MAFKVALRSGLVEVRSFSVTTPEELLKMGLDANSRSTDSYTDEAYDEYRRTILETVGNAETYPLFDDITGGDIVARAVRQGVILPSPADKRRGKQGGLSSDLLQRLPMFEKASVSETLEIRQELAAHLGAFRQAVAASAATIESASWAPEDFAQEAELVFRENIAPAVECIEERVRADRSLKVLSHRYGPALLGGASSIGAFVGAGSALAALASLAAGLASGWQGVASGRAQRKALKDERLYFYYRAGRMVQRGR